VKALTLGLALLLGVQLAPTIHPGELTPADRAFIVARIPRIAIDRFSVLPPTVRDEFKLINCHVPQSTQAAPPANVVTGDLAARGQADWAALCSDGSFSEIRIVWGGPEQCEDRLAARQDIDTLVARGPGVYAYSRGISLFSPEHVERLILRHDLPLSEAPFHDGIEDIIEGAHSLQYCTGGHWRAVP
jgi:hypothetical protein